MKRRAYQLSALRAVREKRSFFLLWRRQGGKSTTLAQAALDEMTGTPGRLVTYASASLLLGREIVMKESAVLQMAIREAIQDAAARGLVIETADRSTHKAVTKWTSDDFTELFENQRLEFRLWHDRTTVSRTQVIAPNPATARGWSGTVMLDEFGFISDFRDLWEAVEPIISSDRAFKFIGATTPPKDDSHYSYEITAPEIGRKFPVDAAGNWYTSEAGELIHRVDIHDAYAAGQKLYDRRTGAELSPDEHFRRSEDKDAWRRNYGIQHVMGGTAACGLIELQSAQTRGVGQCAHIDVESDLDMDRAVAWLREHLDPVRPVGLGWDLATTEKEQSNPSSFSVIEGAGVESIVRLVVTWKTKDPAIARERSRRIIETVNARGHRARGLGVDATNERYFAADIAKEYSALCPVELVVGSESVEVPGRDESINMKTLLGDQLVDELNDNHLTLPPERYIKEDWRLVKKERGLYICVPDVYGRHGDSFDSTKLGLRALKRGGPFAWQSFRSDRPGVGRRAGVLI